MSGVARADLRSAPAWYDPTWHYRVPVSLPAASAVGSTNVVDVDFAALLTQLGISGTFDTNSPRLTRTDGTTLATTFEWTDVKYAGATDAAANSRGELRFLAQEAGAQTYWLYFDVTGNGAKAATALATRINGNFEHSNGATPTNWTVATTNSGGGHNAEVHSVPAEAATVNLPAACSDNATTIENVSNTGISWFLLGYRTNCEDSPGNQTELIRVSRTIAVPAGAAAGNLVVQFRYQAFDSFPATNQYDYMVLDVNGTAVNHTTLGIANPGAELRIAADGVGRSPTYSATILDAGWRTMTLNLAAYAGTNATIRFTMQFYSNDDIHKSWVKLDDIEWSRQTATITNANVQAFGVNITAPNDTGVTTPSVYQVAQTLLIRAQAQATTSAMRADVVNPAGTVVATGVILYDDGTHGDAVAGDRIFTNNGSVVANPTYTFVSADTESTAWLARVFARDASTSTIGATNGHVHRAGQANTPQNQANFWNIDEQVFSLVKVNLVLVKSAATISDPVNGVTNPKSIPGAVKQYTVVATNQGLGASDANTVRLSDPIPAQAELVVTDLGGPGSGPVLFTQGVPTSGLTYAFTSLASAADSLEFSNNGGATWSYTPTPNGNGTDPAVTNIRVSPTGAFAARVGLAPSFTLQFRVRIR
ncbi:MAG TPA: choice-of-anchor X domain-containing protein [Myxococcota bacterium]|nr:choice-of-anchor X domain-containing protein [Myxococcota bacterium]